MKINQNSAKLYKQALEYLETGEYAEALIITEPEAKAGNEYFEHLLGVMYSNGHGIEQSFSSAKKWFQSAALKGLPHSQTALGNILIDGLDESGVFQEGFSWLLKAAKQNQMEAIIRIAELYAKGVPELPQDYQLAAHYFEIASSLGSAHAAQRLAYQYAEGLGVEKNLEQSFQLNLNAAQNGSIDAAFNLGIAYAYGRGTSVNNAEAYKWYQPAAKSGNPLAQHNLAALLAEGKGCEKDLIEAHYWYLKAAEQGSALSMANIGKMYEYGQGVDTDLVAAFSWYIIALSLNNDEAKEGGSRILTQLNDEELTEAYRLSTLHKRRINKVHSNFEELAEISSKKLEIENEASRDKLLGLLKEAQLGNAGAQFTLGMHFISGEFFEQDYDTAFVLLSQAAGQELPQALTSLGMLYFYGHGCEKDESIAITLWSEAASRGDVQAIFNLGHSYQYGEGVRGISIEP